MKTHYTANQPEGRVLLALRAGAMDMSAFFERFNSGISGYVATLAKQGYIVNTDGVYTLTEMGAAVCPNRRDAPLVPAHATSYSWMATPEGAPRKPRAAYERKGLQASIRKLLSQPIDSQAIRNKLAELHPDRTPRQITKALSQVRKAQVSA